MSITVLMAVGGVGDEEQDNFLSALNGCFWSYASMYLGEPGLRALEAACLSAGIRPASRLGAPRTIGPDAFFSLLQASLKQEGHEFLRHAGYHCGAMISRMFVGPACHPSDEARRLIDVISQAFPSMHVVAESRGERQFGFSIQSGARISIAFHAFAWGFLRAAAARLNEGEMPLIEERFEPGDKTWVVSLDWTKAAQPEPHRPTGGRKTPRKR